MVQNSEWGPPLWRILHTLAEKIGKQLIPMLKKDEERIWLNLLKHTEGIMPCAVCRKHYAEWKKGHPLAQLTGDRLQEESRKWLWELHECVNSQRGGGAGAGAARTVPLDTLQEIYGSSTSADLQKDIDTLLEVLKGAMLEGLILGYFVRNWKYDLGVLRRLIGF